MKRIFIFSGILISGLFIFAANIALAQSEPVCVYTKCEAANPNICKCGDDVTDASNPWCCTAGLGRMATQAACQANPECRPVCIYTNCEAANQIDCKCGTDVTDQNNLWCCAVGNNAVSVKAACQAITGCESGTPAPGPAAAPTCLGGAICIDNPLEAESFEELLNSIINFIFWLGMVVFPLMILIAGFYFITAAGDPARAATAKKIIFYAVIGLVIVLFARGLAAVLKNIIGG